MPAWLHACLLCTGKAWVLTTKLQSSVQWHIDGQGLVLLVWVAAEEVDEHSVSTRCKLSAVDHVGATLLALMTLMHY